eukprot:CAMPEP_0178939508 /NCGR_PEP_ID=MMETSP0789-20121207/255_1 /TAXON_ID=3005 /ORGANISM="Rhizosolenia setigera, Strain CCMP 1694" /LENGTH=47 /DNA_ID= /DNA_START= /DNA_END= /DNA_ORIENTATION=
MFDMSRQPRNWKMLEMLATKKYGKIADEDIMREDTFQVRPPLSDEDT